MSEKPASWSDIISVIFGFLTAVTMYLGTQPFNTIFALLLGAAVTYSVQKRLQRETEKRNKNVEYVEKYYSPLLVEIQKIQEAVLDDVSGQYNFTNFDQFKTQPQFYSMGKKLRADFLTFAEKIMKLSRKTSYYKAKARDLICQFGNKYIMSAPGKSFSFVSDRGYSPVNLRYNRESEWFFASLEDCILRGSSPIEIVKNRVANFQEESLEVEFYLDVKDDHGGFGHEYDRKNFPQRKEVLDEIISRAVAELNKDEGYRDFQRELADLRRKAASLSGRLGKYVGEYVSIVNI